VLADPDHWFTSGSGIGARDVLKQPGRGQDGQRRADRQLDGAFRRELLGELAAAKA
jgi:hypothetical protein